MLQLRDRAGRGYLRKRYWRTRSPPRGLRDRRGVYRQSKYCRSANGGRRRLWAGRGALRTDHAARGEGSAVQLPRLSRVAYERDAAGRDVFLVFWKQILTGVGRG